MARLLTVGGQPDHGRRYHDGAGTGAAAGRDITTLRFAVWSPPRARSDERGVGEPCRDFESKPDIRRHPDEASAPLLLPKQDGQPRFVRRQQVLEIDPEWQGLLVADLLEHRDVLSEQASRRPDDAPPRETDDVDPKVHERRLRKVRATEAIG